MSDLHDTAEPRLRPDNPGGDWPWPFTPDAYQDIWQAVVRYVKVMGAREPLEAAAEAVARVLENVARGLELDAKPTPYFCAVARRVVFESWREAQRYGELPESGGVVDPRAGQMEAEKKALDEKKLQCQRRCLGQLPEADRAFMVAYGTGDMKQRQRLAAQSGVTANVLRVRATRLRKKLQECVGQCLALKG